MNSKFVVKLALSTAVVAGAAVTPTSAGFGNTDKVSAKKAGPEKAYAWAKKAEKAFAKGKTERALTFAELAVEADMQNRDYRALLARIYMAQGRFVSAERTLMDVMDLGQVDPRTVISLALTRIAQGNVDSAVALVEANRAIVPVSDYGLTLALAGRSGDAVNVLSDAVRLDGANARTRQNLALAYALDGRWRDARVMAGQDMAQTQVNERIAEWAQFARPEAYTLRVAGLLKVRPNMADTGQPVRLALNAVAPVGLADAGPAIQPVEVPASQPAVELAAIGPAPVADSVGFAAVETAVQMAEPEDVAVAEAPLIKAPAGPAKAATSAPVKLALADVPASTAVKSGGTHVVQLGAFNNAAVANDAWAKLSNRHGLLGGFEPAKTSVTVNGRKFIRLAATGFDSAAAASAACSQIKSQGGVCFVRSSAGTAPVRMAKASGRRIASR
ncbi:MAG: SPOR domain-containing protein [Sphingomonadaceae bacterium]|nr:SPOR domain-containing protein [Sphingomonadaceae bacterium]